MTGQIVDGPERLLVVVADDFGIGPATTRGILDLADAGMVTASVLLTNSPFAKEAVELWRARRSTLELGWHPCLTLDRPVLHAAKVPSLVQADGRFWPLGKFLLRLLAGRICDDEMRAEFHAQLDVYTALVGSAPGTINGHHHIHILPRVREVLSTILSARCPTAYIRRVSEDAGLNVVVSGSRLKRRMLNGFGNAKGTSAAWSRFPGNERLLGLTDPELATRRADYFTRWLEGLPAGVSELACHPGHADETILGRDVRQGDFATLAQRSAELRLLLDNSFREALDRNSIRLIEPRELLARTLRSARYVA